MTLIPTTNPDLNDALGGGFAMGSLSEVFSQERDGRWQVAISLLANMATGLAAVVDLRGDFDLCELADAGVDVSRVLVSQPGVFEVGLDIVERLAESVEVVVVNLPAPVMEESYEAHMSIRLASQNLRRLCSQSRAAVVFLSEYECGSGFCNRWEPCGSALKYFASQRVMVKREEGTPIAKVVKNKYAPPFGVAELAA